LVDVGDLLDAIDRRYVTSRLHPRLPLVIYNYTDACIFARAWNETTLSLRGVIADRRTGRVVARAYRKFWNYTQDQDVIPLDAPVEVADKKDGSLGIIYPTDPGEWAVATRGSFASEQAHEATAIWRERYRGIFTPPDGWTVLTEIIYPANRIVIDYGSVRDLVLLGAVEIATGRVVGPQDPLLASWPGPRTEVFRYATLGEALAAVPRPNAEGLVVRDLVTNAMLKIKQSDYLQIHRTIFGLTDARIWEFAAVNACKSHIRALSHYNSRLQLDPRRAEEILTVGENWLAKVADGIPDEFYDWLTDTAIGFKTRADELLREWKQAAKEALTIGDLRARWESLADHPHRSEVVLLTYGKDVTTNAWLHVRPSGPTRSWLHHSEDVA
jgi:RNA ligase